MVILFLCENLFGSNKVRPEGQNLEISQLAAFASVNPDHISDTHFHFKKYLHDYENFIWSDFFKKDIAEKHSFQDQINRCRSRAAMYRIPCLGSTKESRKKALEKLLKNLKNCV